MSLLAEIKMAAALVLSKEKSLRAKFVKDIQIPG
jgi:hypothetical protein